MKLDTLYYDQCGIPAIVFPRHYVGVHEVKNKQIHNLELWNSNFDTENKDMKRELIECIVLYEETNSIVLELRELHSWHNKENCLRNDLVDVKENTGKRDFYPSLHQFMTMVHIMKPMKKTIQGFF
jgi:hypothetical protein